MGLPLYDPRACYDELRHHQGHRIVCVGYGRPEDADRPVNMAIECETCGEVLIDFNDPNREEL